MKTLVAIQKCFALPLALCLGLTAQAQLLNETFDSSAGFLITDDSGPSNFVSDGSNDYFGIYDGEGDGGADFGAVTTNPSGKPTYTSESDNYLVCEDFDAEGVALPATLTWTSINLSGETLLQISAEFASTRADPNDYIVVSYRLDAGVWVEILGVAGVSTNGPVYEITDFAAQTGDASATAITSTFTNISSNLSLAGTETTLEIKAEISNNNGDDNFGMDDLLVEELTSSEEAITLSASPTTVDEGSTLVVTLSVPTNVSTDAIFNLTGSGGGGGDGSGGGGGNGSGGGNGGGGGSELSIPATVTILSGTNSIDFNVSGLSDGEFDGDQDVTITAALAGYISDSIDITVVDVESATPSGDLIISQYYEGTSYNKYIEVTNIGDNPIDLTGYTIVRWSDALAEEYKTAESLPAENADSLDLSSLGTIQPDQTMVFAHSSAASPLDGSSADLSGDYTSPFGFNGNDSIVIYNSATPNPANIVDAIGFTNSGLEGKDTSFVRAGAFQGYDLSAGSSASSSQFATIWTEITNASADAASYSDDGFIGTTTLATAPTAINFTDLAVMFTEDGVSADLTVEILNPDGANSVSVDVVFNLESSTADTADISDYTTQTLTFPSTAISGEQQTVTVTITDDSDFEGNEEVIFDLSNLVTSNINAQIGRADTATLTILDNDAVIPDLIISEVADPNGTAGTNARFVELYNPTDSTIDLAAGNWSLVRYLATASATKQSVSLTGSILAGGTYVVARSESVFTSTYGKSPDQSNGNISGDGDDSYALFFGGNNITGTLVDLYGDIGDDGSGGIDGSSTDWEYEDGRAVRNSDITSPNATFSAVEWTIYNDSASVNGTAEVADMTPGVHPDPLVTAPTGVSASTVNDSDISVGFTAVDSNDVIVVFDTDGTFTAPTGAAPSLNDSFAGGTVIYVGQASPLAHTGLSADTQYYYSVFSVNGTDYSSVVEVDATTQVAGLIYSEDFDDASGDADDWFNATVTGPDPWDLSGSTASVDGYVGFVDNGAEDHYLVSPALDFSAETAITISFDYEGTYDDGDSDSFELVYSLDYSGSENPEGAAIWTEIPFDFSQNLQTADPVALVNSGLISLPAALEGESVVYLAFRYSAGGGELDSELWELDNILVQSTTVVANPVADYLTVRGLTSDDLGTDTNGNGFTVLEEYLAGFGDGSGSDVISYGIDNGATLALSLTSDLELEPVGIGVALEATSDLGVAFAPVAFSISVVPNDGTFTRIYTETTPPASEQRFLRLSITEE